MDPFSNQPTDMQKKAHYDAMWYYVEQIATSQASSLGKTVTPEFVASLADVVCRQAESMGLDLEAFARHAKRSTISIDDVKLCARRNTGLYDLVSEKADQIARQSKKKRRGIDD